MNSVGREESGGASVIHVQLKSMKQIRNVEVLNVKRNLCCLLNAYAYCYYCNEKWCERCWFDSRPDKWIGSICPVVSRLSDRYRGRHAEYSATFQMGEEYRRRYDEALVNPKDKWDYEVYKND
jgi:hypothetical protein